MRTPKRGALRAPRAGSPAFVSVFVFVLIYVQFEFENFVCENLACENLVCENLVDEGWTLESTKEPRYQNRSCPRDSSAV